MKKFKLVPQYFGSLVFDRETGSYAGFDTGATELFIASGQVPFSEVIQERYCRTESHKAFRFAAAYKDMGYFTKEGFFNGDILPDISSKKNLSGPLTVHLEVSSECNLKCRHCFAANSKSRDSLTLSELESLFRDMAGAGSFRLGLTGGEPLLREDLFDIIDLAVANGLTPCLTTNGLLIDEVVAKRLSRRKFGWLNISLDGACKETNDYIRGAGTFETVMKNVKRLEGIQEFSLAFTVMRHNIDEVKAFAVLARNTGARAAVFRPLYPVGAAAAKYPELMTGFKSYLAAMESVHKSGEKLGIEINNIHPWGPASRRETRGMVYDNFGCGAGNTVCSISVDGNVSPCSFLGGEYVAGNIRQTSFGDIWNDSPVFEHMRKLPGNRKCLGCNHYENCSGGCRVRAIVMNKSINAPDSWCPAEIDPGRLNGDTT